MTHRVVLAFAFLFTAALTISSRANSTTALAPTPGQQDGASDAKAAIADGFAVIKGVIRFEGDVPPPKQILKSKDPEICGTGQRDIVEYKVTKEGFLDETVAFLDGDYEDAKWKDPEGGYVLLQEGCFFKPYMGIIRNKAELKIISKDEVLHNIHAYERIGRARRDLFNFSQPKKDVRTQKIKVRRSQFVELTCDAHDFMAGWRFAAKNPYCTVGTGGTYELEVPAGKHTLKVWHPQLGVQEAEVEVAAGDTKTVDFKFAKEE